MIYYLVFLKRGTVVEISHFNDEQTRDNALLYYGQWAHGLVIFDELQKFNEIVTE